MQWSVGLPGRDQIHLEIQLEGTKIKTSKLTGIGCSRVLHLLVEWRPKISGDIQNIPIPQENDHASILMRQLILIAQNNWMPPYQEQELCHCRAISTERVNMSIIAGAHTPEEVSKKTSASTACGTCRPNVELQIEYFLKTSKKTLP